MGKEIWRQAIKFPGYEVSNIGNIRNANGRIMKCGTNGIGYHKFRRRINGVFVSDYVHRIVADAFVPNPLNKPCINHIDCNPSNNRADNLEWCTKAENTAYMVKLGRNKRTKEWLDNQSKGLEFMRKPVVATSLENGEKIYFSCVNRVKEMGFQPSCVSNCCQHKRGITQHKGFRWEFA